MLIICTAMIGCMDNKYPGFSKGKNDIFYKLHKFGDSPARIRQGDLLALKIHLFNSSDRLIFDNLKSGTSSYLIRDEGPGSVLEAVQLFRSGDSATVYLSADSVYKYFFQSPLPSFVRTGEMLRMEVSLGTYLHNTSSNEKDLAELKQLKKYVDDNSMNVELVNNSFFRKVISNPEGDTIKSGRKIFINYSGRFLDGNEFDTTKKQGYPFDFIYGVPDQVIPGIEKGIYGFTKGSIIRLYLPSFMAFGEYGNSDRRVPPYTPVVYEVEIVDVISETDVVSNTFVK